MGDIDLLDQIDGRLTRLTVGYPASQPTIWKVQKHVKYAMQHPEKVDLKKYIHKSQIRMVALASMYPDFVEHLQPIVELINREQGRSSPTR